MLQTLLIAIFVLGAVLVLVNAWWSGRQSRDPASSVETFHRAMTAMERTAPRGPARDRAPEPDDEELTRT